MYARESISGSGNDVFVSAVSVWEMSIKRSLGKLRAPENLTSVIEQEGFTQLPITLFHAEQAGLLPLHHRDPFDRMLVAQAQAEGLAIVTGDRNIPRYGVRIIAA